MEIILVALEAVFEPTRLLFLLAGVIAGLITGVIPGLGGLFGLALLVPLTYTLDPYSAIALLLGLAAVTTTSDTIPAVLIGVPGSVGAMATVADGNAMAKNNEAARALGAAYSASLIGGIIGAALLALSIPIMRPLILTFRTPDFLAVAMLGLAMVAVLSGKQISKGIAAALVGVILSFVGIDDHAAAERWTFGQLYLWDGLPLAIVFLGLFAFPEIAQLLKRGTVAGQSANYSGSSMWQGVRDTLREYRLVIQSGTLGAGLGALPGVGLTVICWIAYGAATRNRNGGPEFGKGNVRGVIGPESANNASDGGSLIPTIALGIPGGAAMAIVLGALTVQGLVPGPHMLSGKDASVTIAMIFCLAIANIMGALICLALTRQLARIVLVPATTLVPIALVFINLGAFTSHATYQDTIVLLVFAGLGFFMSAYDWPRPAFALGFVLGPSIERYFFLSHQISGWDWLMRPSVLCVLALIASIIMSKSRAAYRNGRSETRFAAPLIYLASSLGLIAVSVFVLTTAQGYPASAALFPVVAAGLLLTVSAYQLMMFLRDFRTGKLESIRLPRGLRQMVSHCPSWKYNGAVVAYSIAFVLAIHVIGHLPATVLAVGGVMLWGRQTSPLVSVICGIATAVVVYLMFDLLISVPWPSPWILGLLHSS